MNNPRTVSLFSRPYLDTLSQCYKNIITVNAVPQGSLANLVKCIKTPPLSHFKTNATCSGNATTTCLALYWNNTFSQNKMMTVDDVPYLISFLTENGYTIDTSITKMFNQSDIRFNTNNANKLICFITYHK
jgi:hypothetical protein